MVGYDERTALLVVDVQNDFADPSGGLAVSDGEAVIPVANEHIRLAGTAGARVVYSQDWHPEVTPHFAKDGGTWPVHCVAGTWGAELHPDLLVAGERIRKGTGGEDGYSAFTVRDPLTGDESPTGLVDLLRQWSIRRVLVIGLATDYCVKETAADANALGFDTSVVAAGVRAVDLVPGDGDRALAALRDAGVTIL